MVGAQYAFQADHGLVGAVEEEKVKVESEKVGLKLNAQKTKIMASGPITSWEIGGETVETVADFTFWGSKITADGDCSHEISPAGVGAGGLSSPPRTPPLPRRALGAKAEGRGPAGELESLRA